MTRADLVLLLLVMFCLPFVYQAFWSHDSTAHYADILTDNHQHQSINLQQDQQIEIKGVLGQSRLEVNHGRIRFVHSPCKGKVCIRQGWLSTAGAFAACLPNKIAIQLSRGQGQYDSINF